ncbi:MAG: hypothetical protein HC938_16040 [Nitrospira sp.]|jgi:hypothetical protein|nr:hypothetical protein [Nitrospira sp.]
MIAREFVVQKKIISLQISIMTHGRSFLLSFQVITWYAASKMALPQP